MSDSRDFFFLPINLMLSTSTGMQRTHEKNQRIIEVGHHPRKFTGSNSTFCGFRWKQTHYYNLENKAIQRIHFKVQKV